MLNIDLNQANGFKKIGITVVRFIRLGWVLSNQDVDTLKIKRIYVRISMGTILTREKIIMQKLLTTTTKSFKMYRTSIVELELSFNCIFTMEVKNGFI